MGRSNYRTAYVINRNQDRQGFHRHTEHDDRGTTGGGQRGVHGRLGPKQVGFVEGPRGGHIAKRRQQHRGGGSHVAYAAAEAAYLDDGDIVVDAEKRSDQAGRGRPIYGAGGRKNWRAMQRRGGPGRTPPGLVVNRSVSSFWSRITLRNAAKYDKVTLLRELLQRSSVKFIPICYQTSGNSSTFFVEDAAASKAIKDLDKTIEMSDGYHLIINIERCPPPSMTVNDAMLSKMKEVMSARYITEHCAINLRAFHADKNFAGEPFYAPLFRTNVLTQVLTVITDHISELKAMDLSENKLTNLDAFVSFANKMPNLSILYLADNRIPDIRCVEKLKGLKLTELKLAGNPIVERLGSSYTATVRKLFPSLQILDDKELPKEIRFEDDEEGRALDMPASQPKLVKSPEAGALVLQFLEQFFLIYDSASRQGLLDAYHENAVMSLNATGSFENLKPYIENSRNLRRVVSDVRRHKLLHKGRLPIVSFLSGLPKTDHDATSFTLDLAFTSKTMMTFTVTGVFRERDSKYHGVRHFNRCFIVVPQGSGFCIVNETLYVCQATSAESKRAFVTPDCTLAAVASKTAATAAAPTAAAVDLDLASKQSLALAFAAKSGMNLEWSAKCLEENRWDFDKSAAVFFELKAAGKVPPAAFVQ